MANKKGIIKHSNGSVVGSVELTKQGIVYTDLNGKVVSNVRELFVKPIVLTGKELGDFPDTPEGKTALREAAINHLTSLKGQFVKCPAIAPDALVEIRSRGIKEFKRFSGNPLKLKAVYAIESIIKNAKNPIWEDNYKQNKKPEAIGYYHLTSSIVIDKVEILADLVIEKDTKGLLHYDYIIKNEKTTTLNVVVDSSSWCLNHKSRVADYEQILHDNPHTSQAMLDSTDDGMVLNLFLQVKDPVTGQWVDVPDELEEN